MFRMKVACLPVMLFLASSPALAGPTGLNVLLNQPVTPDLMTQLNTFGQVLDVLQELNAVTMRASADALPGLRALPFVRCADVDVQCDLAGDPQPCGFADRANQWSLDAINVTDFGGGRVVDYDGEGVYVAVLDTGLYQNWREYFAECSVAVDLARCFGGGGGEHGFVSSQPYLWERDNVGHGTMVTSIILGFRYQLADPPLPAVFNGVAPGATLIPVKVIPNNMETKSWASTMTRGLLYVTGLKHDGVLGNAPLVVNISWGGHDDIPLLQAAIDYAIANGVVVVAAAGNESDQGMRFPGRYPPVISVAATQWIGALPPDDPTHYAWNVNDVPENDPSAHCIAPFSSRALSGQELDVAAPGAWVPVPFSQNSQMDYSFFVGTSAATPHVVGVAALMLQKNPSLATAQIESILKSTALALPPGCADIHFSILLHHGIGFRYPTVRNQFASAAFIDLNTCWDSDATGAGLVQADVALAATPLP